MGAGVYHRVSHVLVRQVRVLWSAVEGKLEDACPGQMEPVAECTHVGRDQSQVFGDEWKTAQRAFDRAEELGARTQYPLTALGCWCTRRYAPRRRERAEMIQADDVDLSQNRADAVDPPTIAGPAKSVPIVDGVPPELSLRAEVVGRDSSHEPGPALFVQQ